MCLTGGRQPDYQTYMWKIIGGEESCFHKKSGLRLVSLYKEQHKSWTAFKIIFFHHFNIEKVWYFQNKEGVE